MMSWIDDILNSTKELESPTSFWYWSSLAAISAIVKDNVFLDRGKAYKLYPNIYVMLLARSGLRKGPPINLAKEIVKKVNNTRIISGRSSIQAILKELGTGYTLPGGKVVNESKAFIVASEFSSSLVEDRASMTILTDLYDRNYNEGEFKSLLKMETFSLKNPTITMLVGTNEPHFEDFITQKDVQGGFIGRMFVIVETKKRRSNPLIDDLENPPDVERLSIYPKTISGLKGQFQSLSKTVAGGIYSKWYNELDESIQQIELEDKTGTLERIGDSVLKVACLLSLADSPDLIITEGHMIEAINVSEKLVGNIRKRTMGKGQSSLANQKWMVVAELLERDNHSITRTQLMKKMWMHMTANECDEVIHTLSQTGYIVTEKRGEQVVYVMPDKAVNELMEFFKQKKRRAVNDP